MIPSPQINEWYIFSLTELPGVLAEIKNEFENWGLQFFNDSSAPNGIILQYESNDSRPLKQKHWYIYVIASYLLSGKNKEAIGVFDDEFNKPGILK